MFTLIEEWENAVSASFEDGRLDQALKSKGVPPSVLSLATAFGYPPGICTVGLACIQTGDDGLYQPHPDGNLAIIMPTCLFGDGLEPDDLIAWRSSAPGKVWRRTGRSTVLDPYSVHRSACTGETLFVFETPLDWLRAGCRGSVILDWSADLFSMFSGIRRIAADLDMAHAELLERLISPKNRQIAEIALPAHRLEAAA